jgi:hypothetical protein
METMRKPGGRYDGRPFLRLLEGYVLDVVGELSPEREARVRAAAGGAADWRALVERELGLQDDVRDALRAMWERTRASGDAVDPLAWTRQVVDANFR